MIDLKHRCSFLHVTDCEVGEPDGGNAENCLILTFGGKLRDVPCTLGSSFNVAACEITMITATTLEPVTLKSSTEPVPAPGPTQRNCYNVS